MVTIWFPPVSSTIIIPSVPAERDVPVRTYSDGPPQAKRERARRLRVMMRAM
jgi:hypothetical protein